MLDSSVLAIAYLGGAGILVFLVSPFDDTLDTRNYKLLAVWVAIFVVCGLGMINLEIALGVVRFPMRGSDILTTGILTGLMSFVFFLIVFGLKKIMRR